MAEDGSTIPTFTTWKAMGCWLAAAREVASPPSCALGLQTDAECCVPADARLPCPPPPGSSWAGAGSQFFLSLQQS